MLSDTPLIVVVNETSVLTAQQAWLDAWGLNYQLRWQFGPLWRKHAEAVYLPKGVTVPSGAWILHLKDTIDQPSALGYHDEDGNEVPFGVVGIKTAEENGIHHSEVVSHEGLELVADPNVNLSAWDEAGQRLLAFEVCDAAQGGSYDIGAPYGRTTGLIVSDFVLPPYFDNNTQPHVATSYRGTVTGSFTVGREGYESYTTKLPPEWQQQLGEKTNPLIVDADHRVTRRAQAQ